ncbi:MAG: Yip1 family protein [Candidatus Aenigmatarchaeota archaeon]
MDILQKARMIFTNSSKFFEKTKAEKKVNDAFIFFVVSSLVSLVATTTLAFNGTMSKFGMFGLGVIMVLAWAINLLFVFISAAIVSFAAKSLGGKSEYVSAYKAVAYGSLPYQLFGWIPFVGAIASIWTLYIQTKGVSKLYKLGKWQSFAAIITPAIVIFALMVLLVAAMMFLGINPVSSS